MNTHMCEGEGLELELGPGSNQTCLQGRAQVSIASRSLAPPSCNLRSFSIVPCSADEIAASGPHWRRGRRASASEWKSWLQTDAELLQNIRGQFEKEGIFEIIVRVAY